MFYVRNYISEGFGCAIVQVGLQGLQTEQRGDVESDALAIAVVIDAQSILCGLQHARGVDDRGGLFVSANVVAQVIRLARHPNVEGADIPQEAIEILHGNGCAEKRRWGSLSGERSGGRSKILYADGPVASAVASSAT